jgi:predicted nucleic acid-binding protein
VNYLIDTSALVRVTRRQIADSWRELVDRGLVTICGPVLTETLAIAGAKQYDTAACLLPMVHQQRISEPPADGTP